jgi:hypothetical protein
VRPGLDGICSARCRLSLTPGESPRLGAWRRRHQLPLCHPEVTSSGESRSLHHNCIIHIQATADRHCLLHGHAYIIIQHHYDCKLFRWFSNSRLFLCYTEQYVEQNKMCSPIAVPLIFPIPRNNSGRTVYIGCSWHHGIAESHSFKLCATAQQDT